MTDTTAREAAFKRVCELMDEARAEQPAPAPAISWSRHGAFDDIAAAVTYVDKARVALDCIGAMLQPQAIAADEQLNMVHRSQAAALFAFFAESLDEPLKTIDEAREHLSKALQRAGL